MFERSLVGGKRAYFGNRKPGPRDVGKQGLRGFHGVTLAANEEQTGQKLLYIGGRTPCSSGRSGEGRLMSRKGSPVADKRMRCQQQANRP